jgi:hypothetical protein
LQKKPYRGAYGVLKNTVWLSYAYIEVPRLIPIPDKEIILELEFIKFFY